MGMVAQGKGNWAYLRFMEKMVRWLTQDPSMDPVQITLPDSVGEVGRRKEIRIKVREEDIPLNGKGSLRLSAWDPEGLKIGSEIKAGGQSGEYLGFFLPEKAGLYKIKVETQAGFLEEPMLIPDPLAGKDSTPDHDRLQRLAASTGGKILSRGDRLFEEILDFAKKRESHFLGEKHSPLWSKFYIIALIVALLSGEWYLRRRWGLI